MFEIVTFPTNTMKQNDCIVLLFLISLAGRSLCAENVDEKSLDTSEIASYKLDKYGHRSFITDDDERDLSLKETETFDAQPYSKNKDQSISISNIITKLRTSKWSHSFLTYSIRSYPLQLNQSTTKNIIRQAFKTWFDHIPLTIKETCSRCQSDFVIDFLRQDDTNEYPFDGLGGILSQAYPPEDGRILFDKEEIWTDGFDEDKTDLYSIALHEIGHALGLYHSSREDSIMYPVYRQISQGSILSSVDRKSIQRLYGKKQSLTATTTKSRLSTQKKNFNFNPFFNLMPSFI